MYLESVITCVDYGDFLAHTLPHNRVLFDRTVVKPSILSTTVMTVAMATTIKTIKSVQRVTTTMTIDKTNFLYYLASSFATAEGWQDANGRPRRNNNPGDLRNADPMFPKRDAALNGFVVFPSPEAGIASLYRQLLLDIARGWSIHKVVYTYAPPGDYNNSENYLTETMRRMQMKPEDIDTPLWNFLGLEYIP